MNHWRCRNVCVILSSILVLSCRFLPGAHAAEEKSFEYARHLSLSAGLLQFEGDEQVKDGFLAAVHLGYDATEWWSWEGVLSVAPQLDENFRTEWRTGEQVSRLQESAGVSETEAVGLALDGLYHFTRWERLDPYLSLGVGFLWYADDFDEQFDPSVRVGGGVMYHLTDVWSLRADGRTLVAGGDTEANATVTAGIMWALGVHVAPQEALTGPLDSDGDGLPDSTESSAGTNPFAPDSDRDGLTDTQEVKEYKTDPLNRDTDWDGLADGAEVLEHKTDPLKQDTDGGKVADGHEIDEDGTDALDGSDDLRLFDLKLEFDSDTGKMKPDSLAALDAVGKALSADSDSRIRIESHVDKRKEASAWRSRRLTRRRARTVADYLNEKWEIGRDRMKPVGCGFDHPRAANDPVGGNPENRRVAIYVRSPEG
jgi:outer membrane protein OmpA-like peptidoglycan-associated protein